METSSASVISFTGTIDKFEQGSLFGWLIDSSRPGEPVDFRLKVNGLDIGQFRADIRSGTDASEAASGAFGFQIALNIGDVKAGVNEFEIGTTAQPALVSRRMRLLLRDIPGATRAKTTLFGKTERVEGNNILGFVYDTSNFERTLRVALKVNGAFAGEFDAGIYRKLLQDKNIGTANYGFRIPVPSDQLNPGTNLLEVVAMPEGHSVGTLTLDKSEPTAPIAEAVTPVLADGAPPGRLVGRFERIEGHRAVGIVYDETDHTRALKVVVRVNGQDVAEGMANLYRKVLEDKQLASPLHGFNVPFPVDGLPEGETIVEVIAQPEDKSLGKLPLTISTAARPESRTRPQEPDTNLIGRLEKVQSGQIIGWAHDTNDASRTLNISIRINEQAVGEIPANLYRKLLEDKKVGTAHYGFCFEIPEGALIVGDNRIEAEIVPEGKLIGTLTYQVTRLATPKPLKQAPAIIEPVQPARPVSAVVAPLNLDKVANPGEAVTPVEFLRSHPYFRNLFLILLPNWEQITQPMILKDEMLGLAAGIMASEAFQKDILASLVQGLPLPGQEGDDHSVHKDLRNYAQSRLFQDKFNIGEAENWPRLVLRILLSKNSLINTKSLIDHVESNSPELVAPLRATMDLAVAAAQVVGEVDPLIGLPLFQATASPDAIHMLFNLLLGREPTEKDNLEKSAREGYDTVIRRLILSNEFERKVLDAAQSGKPLPHEALAAPSDLQREFISELFGIDSITSWSIQDVARILTAPAMAAALRHNTSEEHALRLDYLVMGLKSILDRFALPELWHGVLFGRPSYRRFSLKSPVSHDPESGLPLRAELKLTEPRAYSTSAPLTLAADGMWEANIDVPVFREAAYSMFGQMSLVVPTEVDGQEALVPLVTAPVSGPITLDNIKGLIEKANGEADRAVYVANLGRLGEAVSLLERVTEATPFQPAPWVTLAEILFIDQNLDAVEALIDRIPSDLLTDTYGVRMVTGCYHLARGDKAAAIAATVDGILPCKDPIDALVRFGAGLRDADVMAFISDLPEWVQSQVERIFDDLSAPLSGFVTAINAARDVIDKRGLIHNLLFALIRVMAPYETLTDLMETARRLGAIDVKSVLDTARQAKRMYTVYRVLGVFAPSDFKDDAQLLAVARMQERFGKYELGLTFVENVIGRKPNDETALQLAANLLRRLGKGEQAIAHMAKALEIKADDRLAERLLALDLDAIKKNPLHPRGRAEKLLNQLLERRQKTLFANPRDIRARFDYARSCILAEQYEEAGVILERLAFEKPEWMEPKFELIRLSQLNGDNAATLRYFKELGAEEAKNERWVVAAVKAYRALGDIDSAHELLIANLEQDSVAVRREYVRNLFFVGNFDEAVKEAVKWLQVYPDNLELRLLTAAAFLEIGNYEQACFHTCWVYMNGGLEAYPAEMPLFLYAVSHKIGDSDLALTYLNPMFSRLGVQGLKRDIRLGEEMFDQLAGSGEYPTATEGYGPVFDGPLVSVVMTSYNVETYIRTAARSILEQSYRNLELIIVDDASTDSTPEILMEIERSDPRVKVILKTTNDGTYVSKNTGLLQAQGEIIALQDSDDWSHPDRIACSVSVLLKHPELVGLTTDWLRMTTPGDLVIKAGGQISHLCCISLVFRRAPVLDKIGFFDSVRIAADLELIQRLGLVFGSQAVLRLRWPLLFGRARSDSLTASEEFGLSRTGFTEPRQLYHDNSEAFHSRVSKGASAYLPFPMTSRAFDAPAIILPERLK